MSLVGESKSLFRTGAWVVFRDGGSTMGTCRVFMAAPGVIRQCNLAVKKTIMRLHRVKLDPAMRSLGDTYARKEFRLHAKPQVQEAHKQMFLKEWRAYVALCFLQKAVNIPQKLLIVGAAIDMVSSQATVTGQELSEEQKSKLNDQQKALATKDEEAKAEEAKVEETKAEAEEGAIRNRGPARNKTSPPTRSAARRNAEKRSGRRDPRDPRGGGREDGMFRHSEITGAHKDAVMSVVMAADCIYTASRDKTLKRWKVNVGASGKFELQPERPGQRAQCAAVVGLEVPLGEVCWCLISAGDWLFCGLGDGNIKGFMKSGQQTVLSGHQKRVSCLMTHQHVLLSGASDGAVRCWQMNPHTTTFECTHGISEGISGSVTALAVLGEGLWVGGSSGLALVELATLKVVKQLNPRKFVAGLLQFEGHMIVVYADGSICIFDGLGGLKHQQPALPAGPVLCIAGLESGPRVLCGHAKGQVSSITLPNFVLKKHWQALERCKVQTLCCAGHDGIYVLGAENGSLQLWQRDGSVDI
ncbi:unnamed protein product [Durusdinium trenchii]|uniref:Uncharacterized protein n=1 Tax=Durusdinium trenchii TaxID=1381693 RepID=A0ABP0R139_9DINO